MLPDFHTWIDVLWMAFAVVWLTASLTVKRNARVQPSLSLLTHSVTIVAAFLLLLWSRLSAGPLSWRLVPDSVALSATGWALTFAGLASAIWARFFLGRNWSGLVVIKHDHQLVRRGPYAVVRHPIYTGLTLGMLGAALALGELRGLLGAGLAAAHWWTKSQIEERFLLDEFGAEYAQYRREVKALIPFLL
jgi:protein-S-isoprenylcysteine O-methyltransferase Ste14